MTNNREYEIVIVGGGPAGLSAARTSARLGYKTLLLERSAVAGESVYPSTGILAPIPGVTKVQPRDDALYYPELDLQIPSSLIIGYPPIQRYASPGGYEVQVPFAAGDDEPVIAVDRPGLLRLMAEQARTAGADLQYNTTVTGLLYDGDRVAGVDTIDGAIQAQVVMAAEGTARQFAEQAGLYQGRTQASRYAFTVSQEMEAPAVGVGDLGQVVTFGRRYSSAPSSIGTVIMASSGRASVYFTLYTDQARDYTVQGAWTYLDEYVQCDPRISHLLAGGRILSRSGSRRALREAPDYVVADGFLGLGDAITPGGHFGILPAISNGRQAALVAAEALDEGDVCASALAPYAESLQGPMLRSMETESRVLIALTSMADDEIDRLCQTLSTLRKSSPFFANWRAATGEAIAWMFRQFPLIARDWELLQRIIKEAEGARQGSGATSMSVDRPELARPPVLTGMGRSGPFQVRVGS